MRQVLFGQREPLTPEERRLVLRGLVALAVPLALITVAALLIGGVVAVGELRGKAQANKEATERATDAAQQAALLAIRLDEERLKREVAIAKEVYQNCIENENQDEVNTSVYRTVRKLLEDGQPSSQSQQVIDALSDAIAAREPDDEMDCVPPPGGP